MASSCVCLFNELISFPWWWPCLLVPDMMGQEGQLNDQIERQSVWCSPYRLHLHRLCLCDQSWLMLLTVTVTFISTWFKLYKLLLNAFERVTDLLAHILVLKYLGQGCSLFLAGAASYIAWRLLIMYHPVAICREIAEIPQVTWREFTVSKL